MSVNEVAFISAVFFATSMISVVTGATSLITVPTLLMFGCEPRTAIATNMLSLTFLSAGATIPFVGDGSIDQRRAPVLISLTVLSSAFGALLVFTVPPEMLPVIIAVMMFAIAGFVILYPNAGVGTNKTPSPVEVATGYLATFLLGIYGGFFSGGYVTMLTAAWVALFQMPFRQAVGTTKLINTASSLTAVLVFAYRGTVNWPLGLFLSLVMFLGGIVGARVALRMNNVLLRRVFLVAVILLALKTIATDIPWSQMFP